MEIGRREGGEIKICNNFVKSAQLPVEVKLAALARVLTELPPPRANRQQVRDIFRISSAIISFRNFRQPEE